MNRRLSPPCCLALAMALLWLPPGVPAEERKFTAQDGRALTGTLIAVEGEMVTIRRTDGATFTVRGDTFSLEDQQYFKTAAPKPAPPSAAAGGGGKGKAPPAPKVTASQIRSYPFCPTLGDERLDPKKRGIFDELRVSASDRIRIQGRKGADTGTVDGRVAYHLGKVAVFPPGNRTGKLTAPLAAAEDVRRYFGMLEVGEKFVTKEVKLGENTEHAWSLTEEGGNTVLKISMPNNESVVISAPTASVTGAGFAATVRWIGNEADLRVTFDDPQG